MNQNGVARKTTVYCDNDGCGYNGSGICMEAAIRHDNGKCSTDTTREIIPSPVLGLRRADANRYRILRALDAAGPLSVPDLCRKLLNRPTEPCIRSHLAYLIQMGLVCKIGRGDQGGAGGRPADMWASAINSAKTFLKQVQEGS